MRIPCATLTDDSVQAGKKDLADALEQLVEAEVTIQQLQADQSLNAQSLISLKAENEKLLVNSKEVRFWH